MGIKTAQCFCVVHLVAAVLLLNACDATPKEWNTPNMTELTPRLQSMFEKTKTVCFGRFMVVVPATATVVWGEADVPVGIRVYPNGIGEVKTLEQKFIDELKGDKAINHDDVPLLLSVDKIARPEGTIVTGYEDFQAIDGLKINAYFRLNNDGVVVDSRPLTDDKEETLGLIRSIARRLRQRGEDEVPVEPGNCLEYSFLPDEPDKEPRAELIGIGFRLKEFPDAHLSIYVAPSNPHNPQGDSLEAQWKRIVNEATPEEKKALANTKFFRKGPRHIHEWQTGYEVLTRSPDEEGSFSHHDFQAKFIGMPRDAFKPFADIQFQTGVANDAAGTTKASLRDDEAIAIWDRITSTIRVRPTNAESARSAGIGPQARIPLGELAATGRICPQTGWWEPTEPTGPRQQLKAGDRMPHLMLLGEPSIWQKLRGERPVNRTATTWKLVAYHDETSPDGLTPPAPTMAQASPESLGPRDAGGGTTEGGQDEQSSQGG